MGGVSPARGQPVEGGVIADNDAPAVERGIGRRHRVVGGVIDLERVGVADGALGRDRQIRTEIAAGRAHHQILHHEVVGLGRVIGVQPVLPGVFDLENAAFIDAQLKRVRARSVGVCLAAGGNHGPAGTDPGQPGLHRDRGLVRERDGGGQERRQRQFAGVDVGGPGAEIAVLVTLKEQNRGVGESHWPGVKISEAGIAWDVA